MKIGFLLLLILVPTVIEFLENKNKRKMVWRSSERQWKGLLVAVLHRIIGPWVDGSCKENSDNEYAFSMLVPNT